MLAPVRFPRRAASDVACDAAPLRRREIAALEAELRPLGRPPATPFAFLLFLIRAHAPWRVGAMIACALLLATCDAFAPVFLGRTLNSLNDGSRAIFSLVLLASVWVSSLLLLRLYDTIDRFTSPRLRAFAQSYLFAYLLGHAPRYFQDNFAGKLGQKIKQAGTACLPLVNILTLEVVYLLGLMAVAGTLFWRLHPLYAGIYVVWATLFLALSTVLARHCHRLSIALSDAMTTSTGRLIDAIANADIVRAFAKADFERRLMGGFLVDEMIASRNLRGFLVVMRLAHGLAAFAFLFTLAGLALRDTLAGRMDAGTFTMVFMLAAAITTHLRTLSGRLLEFFEQLGVMAEALDLVSRKHDIEDVPGAPPLIVRAGAIRFEHVAFAHPDAMQMFEDLNLDIAPGEKIGLVGPSGAGKSTLVKLLRRQFEPSAGRIVIDGQDIARVRWDSLNEAIAEVPQSPGVFHRPVGDNIRYARPDAEEATVIRAATQAHAHEFIARRREGYGTVVGEQGIKLSGGERQRVAIARALVKDARILVMDEATSALDSESEHLIQQALWTVMQGRTVIAIAHRLSTIAGLDRIVYLEAGRIIEIGSHAELLLKGGAYARLWNRQAGGFIAG